MLRDTDPTFLALAQYGGDVLRLLGDSGLDSGERLTEFVRWAVDRKLATAAEAGGDDSEPWLRRTPELLDWINDTHARTGRRI